MHPDFFSIIFPVHFLVIVLCKKAASSFSHHLCASFNSLALMQPPTHIVFVHLVKDFCHPCFRTCIVTIRWDLTLTTNHWQGPKWLHNNTNLLLGNILKKVSTNCVALRFKRLVRLAVDMFLNVTSFCSTLMCGWVTKPRAQQVQIVMHFYFSVGMSLQYRKDQD